MPLFVAWRVCCHFLKPFGRERFFCFCTVLLALNIQVGLIQAIQVFTSGMHCPVPCGSLHSQWRGINSLTAIYWDKTNTMQIKFWWAVFLPSHAPVNSSRLWAVAASGVFLCCFWSFPQQLHETGMMLVRSDADQPALTNSLQKWGAGDPFAPSRGAEQGAAVCSNVLQCWEADTSLWAPQLRELLPSALWELNSSLNESWESGCVNSACQGKPLICLEWVSRKNFQALNSFPDLTMALLISALLNSLFATSLTLSTDCSVTA